MSTTLSERLRKLSPAKRMILLKSMREDSAQAEGSAAIARRAQEGPAPLSFAQQRLWFLNEFAPGGAIYNLHAAVRLTGRLRVDVLERTLSEIVRRHESLRTTFAVEGESPAQFVAPSGPVKLRQIDLRRAHEPEAEARRLADSEAQTPFDLARGPLFRCTLLRLAESQHVVLFTMHHIVSDGWSAGVLVRELFTLYEAYARGEASPLPELPVQYADYAAWQRQWLSGEVLEGQLSYWREQLAGAPPVLELPTDRPRPAVQTQKGARHEFVLDAELREGLKRLGRREGATLFMTLLAAFQVLLARYTGQPDVVVGSPVAGRTRRELEGLIGFFVNTLALRTRLHDDPTFSELLGRVRETALGAFAHQDVPFEKLVEELQPERSLSHTPLFQVVFVLQNAPHEELQSPGLTFERFEHEAKTAKFDLTLSMTEAEEGLKAAIEYSTDLFDAATVERMSRHFETLLRGITRDPARRVSELPLLAPEERRRLLASAGDALEFPQHLCLHERFERQARLSPHAPALTSDAETLSYSELNARANQLAHYLRRHGLSAESRVALLVERSAEMIVSILGVLKAGGCYVPLDPLYPAERNAFMLADSGAGVLLTDSGLAAKLPPEAAARGAVRLVCLDAERDRLAAEPVSDLGVRLDPASAAYVIYTSGSTGVPKGVVVTHANVGRLFDSTLRLFNFTSADVWTLFHSYAFDFSVWELWGALLHGGRLVVVPYWVSRSPEALRRLLAGEGVTVLSQTPSAFRQLIAEEARVGGDGAPLCLRTVVFGGEALEPASLRGWVGRYGDSSPDLINMYGITETTVHVTYRRIGRGEVEGGGASAVGRALGDLRLYVLGEGMEPTPEGVAGELYVGGAGLARGYLNRPALTAERFVPDPFSVQPGERLYRTGDVGRLVRRGDEYEVEYLGRCDQQVKVRGFRIELGEVEAALCGHTGIREAAVVAREGADGHKHLVAYYVACEGGEEALSAAELRQFLSGRLPEHMVPSFFVSLGELPLTGNGKLDRRALPEPDAPAGGGEYVAPRNSVEEALCEIWRGVLGVERVGIEDNFFELGGDSIRSIQLKARAQQLGLDFDVQQLFRHQTVRELARAIGAAQAETGASAHDAAPAERTEPFGLVSAEDRDRLPAELEDAYPLTHLQAGMAFHSEYSPESAIYHDIFSYHLRTPFDAGALRAALGRLAARHPALRTSFALTGLSEPLQLVHREVEIPLAIEDLRGLSDREQDAALDAWIEEEKRRGFDWRRPPLLRFQVHLRGAETFQLTLSFHHIILDGWSVASMNTELFRLYFAALAGEDEAVQPAPANVFRDFVAAERRTLSTPRARDFWARRLADATLTPLPRWEASAAASAPREIRLLEIPVAPEVSDGLKGLASAASAPIKTVLLAAHLRVMALLAGQSDVLTGVVSNGRPERADGERALGLFLNTLPFRLGLRGGNWLDLVRDTFEAELELLPHRLYPMAEVQRMHGGERLFETMFNFTHFHVYQGLAGFKDLELLKGKFYQETSLTLSAHGKLELATGRVNLSLEYDARQLCDEQISAIAGYYGETLRAMAFEPRGSYLDRTLLPARELEQLAHWNDTARETRRASLGELFEEQAARTPDSVAVVFEGRSLTYAELNRRANQLARHLRGLGVGPDVRVGICVGRSPEMALAVLGVLKAGGCYVPLDPTYPEERLRFMLEDAGAPVILTQQSLAARLRSHASRLLALDADWPSVAREREENFDSDATPETLAYVLFTSGSTGRPKGVAMSHGALVNLIEWQTRHAHAPTGARTLQFASLNFDVSFQEFFATWCAGGTLVLVSERVRQDPTELLAFIARERVERLFLPFVALQQLADAAEGAPSLTRTLREVVTAGEQLQSTPALAALFRRLGGCVLENQYGPTESHVVTAYTLDPEPTRWAALPPIGMPVANTQIHVLDASLQPAPVGVAGELYLGGANLARGYLNRPRLTAERFIPDPFAPEPGARLYKTGDLARRLPDGNVEYLGRLDHQVKIRGLRVELGEIESVLRRHARVQECVVVARDTPAGGKQLVAYVAAPNVTHAELREHLRAKLPEHMVPATFVTLARLPHTPNGKVDRRALPAPGETAREAGRDYVAPRTPCEEIVAAVWQQVLGAGRVGACDNFFELGGHSLSATQVVLRLRRAFNVELPLRTLFEAPTPRELASRVEAALGGAQGAQAPPVVRVPRGGGLPLSFAQQRLWFLHQLDPEDASYHLPFAVRLEGALDVAAFRRALGEVVRRHESLRTTFAADAGRPAQVISSAPDVLVLPLVDLSALPPQVREAEAGRLAALEARLPFDLARGPVLRCSLLRLAELEHAALLTMHHIVSDAWSLGVLVREVATLYAAQVEGRESPLEELTIQYADYASWQRGWLQGEVLEEQLSYWRQQLEGAPPVLELPTDRPRPVVQTHRGGRVSFALPPELSRELKELSRREGATLFMTLLAAFQVLLARYTGQPDVVVGTSIAGRARLETEPLIGFFVNTLALRTRLHDDPTFSESLGRVRETALGAFAHQDVPFEKLVEELQPERSLSHTPLFQVVFVLQNAPQAEPAFPGVRLSKMGEAPPSAKYDLTVSLAERGDDLSAAIEYAADLFDAATVERIAAHFRTLLAAAVARPDARLSELPLLTDEERQRLLVEWNDTRRDYPANDTIHRLFERQAARTPDAVALVCGDVSLTYAELDARANQLARHLHTLGVGPEVRVAILLERSPALVVSILAVLKAGGAYVPLDPDYPLGRLSFMLADSGAAVVLTREGLLDSLPSHRAQEVCVDSEWEMISATAETGGGDSHSDGVRPDPDGLAYVMYTSGSTGEPKGVAVTHRNVSRLVFAQTYARFGPSEVFLLLAPPCFDASTFELWGALLHGARLAVMPPGPFSLAELGRALSRHGVTTLWLTSGLFQQAVEQGVEALSGLRQLLAGGDIVSPGHAARYLKECGGRLVNGYGPTEATTFACCGEVLQEEAARGAALPIGRPLMNTRVYVLDAVMSPVPLGVAGELYIGGDGLARGYLNDPALTAERFVPDPFSAEPGGRLYRTGDVAKYLADGRVEFVGRRDGQVKVRGFRVEVGEVEAALTRHPRVSAAAVVVRGEGAQKRLVAYVVPRGGASGAGGEDGMGGGGGEGVRSDELRRFLSERLPEHMVPSLFVELEALPLTGNGKVDRKALPEPEASAGGAGGGYVAPRGVVEEAVALIWQEVLKLERVGAEDNFFELGGHSLLATQVVSQVKEIFDVELPLRGLFEWPTVGGVAASLAEQSGGAAEVEAIARAFVELAGLSEDEVRVRLLEHERASETAAGD